jgi:hypothetical protein
MDIPKQTIILSLSLSLSSKKEKWVQMRKLSSIEEEEVAATDLGMGSRKHAHVADGTESFGVLAFGEDRLCSEKKKRW